MKNPADPIRLLVVDDNPGDVLLIKTSLNNQKHFYVDSVASLREAFQKLDCKIFDVVLLNLCLPDSIGIDTLKTFLKRTNNLPVVDLTGLEDEGTGLQAIQGGAQDFLVKGRDTRILPRVVQYAHERKRLESLRSDMINAVSHELRTPLAILHSALANLRDGLVGDLPEKQKKIILLYSDRDMIFQVLANLFHNAYRFAQSKVILSAQHISKDNQTRPWGWWRQRETGPIMVRWPGPGPLEC